jgi:hypothetical protein
VRKSGHGDVCDRVTIDENATGVPRVFAAAGQPRANHRPVMWLAPIASGRLALRSAGSASCSIRHIRNAAVEFRVPEPRGGIESSADLMQVRANPPRNGPKLAG